MNTDRLARATFVLERETNEQLARIARRFGVSRSTLVRDVLAEPVALMAKWLDQVPANGSVTEDERQMLLTGLLTDLSEFAEKELGKHGHE